MVELDARPCVGVSFTSGVCARVASRDTLVDTSAVILESVHPSRGTRKLRNHATPVWSEVEPRVIAGRFALSERRWRCLKYLLMSSSGT